MLPTQSEKCLGKDLDKFRLGIAHFSILLQYLAEQGVTRSECLRHTGVTPGALDDPESLIVASQELSLIRLLQCRLGNPFEHGIEVGLRQGLTAYGAWGLGVMSSADGEEAQRWAARFASVAFPLVRYQWRDAAAGPMVVLDYQQLPADVHQFLIARDLASIWAIHQDLLPGIPIGIFEISLAQACEQSVARLKDMFRCRIVTGQSCAAITVDPAILRTAFPSRNALTMAQCELYCQELISHRKQAQSLSDEVREFLKGQRKSLPRVAQVAERFNRTERSLRRQLRREGTGWRELRDEALAYQARRLLRSGQYSIEQVAEQLGYTDRSSFCHAFKRWTGVSPVLFRQGR